MQWTHNICKECWNEKNPNRPAFNLNDAEEETCCFCGKKNTDGIFVREHPNNVKYCACKEDD